MTNNHNPRPAYAWMVVIILFFAYALSFIDRQVMSLLIGPIKNDLGISDTQVSLLIGTAFALFYTTLAIPLGRLADRFNRCWVISIAIFLWSLMTAACGLAKSFSLLFLARMGVGVGESALNPAAYSLISDYFPKEKRAAPIGLYSMGVFFGAGLAYLVGGAVVQWVSTMDAVHLPVLSNVVGDIRPWQLTFLVISLPGLLVVAMMSLAREPSRKDVLQTSGATQHISVKQTVDYLWQRRRVYLLLAFGYGLMGTLSIGFIQWVPELFKRYHQWNTPQIAYPFGLILMIIGTFGTFSAGYIADKMIARGVRDAYSRIALVALLGIVITGPIGAMVSNGAFALTILVITVYCMGTSVSLASAAINAITPNQVKGQAIAIYGFVLNVLGWFVGPTAVALITDKVFADEAALPYSLALFLVGTGCAALLTLWAGLKPYRQAAEGLH